MFPNLGYLYEAIFHRQAPGIFYVFQSFGFMMAMAFIFAAWVLSMEMKRKEQQGLLQPVMREVETGAPASVMDLITNGILGFVLGLKLVGIVLNWQSFQDDPQGFLLSWQGNLVGGFVVALLLVFLKYREKEKHRLPQPEKKMVAFKPHQLVGDITITAAITGLIGAKIFDSIEHMDDLIRDPLGTLVSFSGLAFYGGLIFGSLGVIFYSVKNKLSVIHMADAVAPALIIAYGIGRVGCQVAGDGDWGIENLSPKPSWFPFPGWLWAYNYPHNVINEGVQIPGCVGKYCFELAHPVFPTPVYETIFSLLIFFFLWSMRKRITVPGMLFSVYLILNGIERFFIEMIRVDVKYHFLGINATQAQIIAFFVVLTGIVCAILFWKMDQRKKETAQRDVSAR